MGEGSGSQTWFGSCCFAPIRLAPGPFLGCESAQTHRGTCWEVSSGHGCPAQDWTRSGGLLRGPTPGQGRESWLREKTEDMVKECWERVRAATGTQTWPKARGSTAPEAPPQGLAEAPGTVLPEAPGIVLPLLQDRSPVQVIHENPHRCCLSAPAAYGGRKVAGSQAAPPAGLGGKGGQAQVWCSTARPPDHVGPSLDQC